MAANVVEVEFSKQMDILGHIGCQEIGQALLGFLTAMSISMVWHEVRCFQERRTSMFLGSTGTRLWTELGGFPVGFIKRNCLVVVIGVLMVPTMPVFILYEILLFIFSTFYFCTLMCWYVFF